MEIKLFFAIIGAVIGVAFSLPYYFDIFALKTKPHIYTWFIWLITTATATVAAFYGNGGWGLVNLVLMTIIVFGVFVISIKYGTKNITKWDGAILVMAILAILVWWQLHRPLISVFMVTAIDVLAYLPSFRKSWEEPWSETLTSWLGFAIANVFAVLSLKEYNLLTTTYLVAIGLADVVLYLICLIRRPLVKKQ